MRRGGGMADTGALRAPISNGVRVRLPLAAQSRFARQQIT